MARSQRRSVALQCRLGRSRSRHGSGHPAPHPGRHQAVRGVAGQTSPSCSIAARTAGRADSRAPKSSRCDSLPSVPSGAIALGARRLKLPKGGRSCVEYAQAAAATGQIALSHKWAELLEAKGLTAAQILVTLDDLEHRRRYLNASATLERLLGLGVVPVEIGRAHV